MSGFKKNMNKTQITSLPKGQKSLSCDGEQILDQCQTQLLMIKIELSACCGFLRNTSNCDFSSEEFMGLSLIIDKLSKNVGGVSDRLDKIIEIS